jgi:hypothetical protein
MTFKRDYEAQDASAGLTGHTVVDSELARVGKVTDVLSDESVGVARWAVVKTGLIDGEHIMPLDGSYLDTEDRLVVPFNRAAVKRTPRIGRDHVLTPRVIRDLRDYYSTHG